MVVVVAATYRERDDGGEWLWRTYAMRLRRAVPGGWFRRVGDAEGGGGSCCKGDDGCRGRWRRDGRAARGERASPGIGSSTFLRHCDVGIVIISSSSSTTTSSSSSSDTSYSRCCYLSLTSFYALAALSFSPYQRHFYFPSLASRLISSWYLKPPKFSTSFSSFLLHRLHSTTSSLSRTWPLPLCQISLLPTRSMSRRFRINENFQIRQLSYLPGQIEFCLPSCLSLSSNRFATARSRQMIRIVFRTIRGEEGKGSLVRGIY